MHPYLSHLLGDIAQAKANPPHPPVPLPEPEDGFEAHMAQVEAYLHGPMHDFGYWTGIPWEALPPPEEFGEADVAILTEALIGLWQAYNADPEFPKGMPAREKYRAMRDSWKEEITMMQDSSPGSHFSYDFCSGYAPGCALGKYCSCWAFWEEERPET